MDFVRILRFSSSVHMATFAASVIEGLPIDDDGIHTTMFLATLESPDCRRLAAVLVNKVMPARRCSED